MKGEKIKGKRKKGKTGEKKEEKREGWMEGNEERIR